MPATSSHWQGTKVLITGASGFIGLALMRRLLQAGAQVHGIYRRVRPVDVADGEWRQCDLTDPVATRHVVNSIRPEVVFHLAGHVVGGRELSVVAPTLQSNFLSTVNLLTVLGNDCRRIVLTGSMEEPVAAADWPVPSSPYAAAKLAANAYGRMFHRLYGTPVVILRLFMVYGPGQQDLTKLIPYTILSLLNERPPRLSSGRRHVDWVYVDDVVEAYLAAGLAPPAVDGGTFDIASGELVTVRAVVERLTQLVNPPLRPRFGAAPDRAYEQEPAANLRPTAEQLHWRPCTPLTDGLARTVEWYRQRATDGRVAAVTS